MRALLMLAAMTLALPACRNDSQTPQPGPPTGDLHDGDWKDTGPFATCRVDLGAATCGSLASFDTSTCTPGGLATLELDGVYTLHVRAKSPQYGGAYSMGPQAMKLAPTGTQFANGLRVDRREVDARGNVYISALRAEGASGSRRRSYLGCQSPEPGRLQGCYVDCYNGQVQREGTFEARKVTAIEAEPESSGLERVSETLVPGTPVDIYVTRGHAYVVSLGAGLFVYDVRDPSHPVLTRSVQLPNDNYWNGVWAKDDALYVASGARGVIVFDITDPARPVEVLATGSQQRTNVHTVFVHEDRLFAASPAPTGEVLVYDISQPLTPRRIGGFQAEGFTPETSNGPHDMFVFEGRLYTNFWRAGYVIAQVEREDDPKQLGSYRYRNATSHANAVARFGERIIAFEGGEDWGAHLRVLDVTDPASVKLLGEYRRQEHISLHNMVLVGTKLYVAWYQEGVRVLDVSTPENPREVAHYNTFRPEDPGRGESFYDGAIGIRVPGDGFVYTVDTSRGLILLRETAR
ncbi:LVIVD repeat-containing protein [Myxococcus landrumensis]|uniref:Lipoprotein n=1 Tax=Myxococcus landrumensis TaxID=2813577 RepID=A0ABX7MWC3_9BACT|nr:hypothetical protein [Myxococcus landrumus]QSQ10694.1 hypothetical protein JY572_19805 [Myxococcus landrumus]